MDRNTIIGIIVLFGLFIGYSIFISPSEEELAEQRRRQDSIARVRQRMDSLQAMQEKRDSIKKAEQKQEQGEKQETRPEDLTKDIEKRDKTAKLDRGRYGLFANSAYGDNDQFTLENNKIRVKVNRKGGEIGYVELKNYRTYDSLPLILFKNNTSNYGFEFPTVNLRTINTSDLFFQPYVYGADNSGQDHLKVTGNDSLRFAMRLYVDATDTSYNKQKYIEFLYTLRGDDYMMDFDVNFVGMQDVITSNLNYIDLDWRADVTQQEKSTNRLNGSTIYYKFLKDEVDYLSERSEDEEELQTDVKWISFKQQFFVSTLIAGDFFSSANVKVLNDTEKEGKGRYLRTMETNIRMPFDMGSKVNIPMHFYFGPNKYSILSKYDLDLERQIPLGWSFFLLAWINRYAVIPVFTWLEGYQLNYGVIILILTVLLKIVLFPIAYKTYMSQAKMRVLKPEIDEIGKKFPKKEDAMKKQQATMQLYKKAGVNPMAGCVPMLLQLPILIALFRFFPASIELRQQSFLWATDLSTYDSILQLPFSIPFYGDHVSLFTILMAVSTIIYSKLNSQQMSTGNQMPGMKNMMYIMPVMLLFFFNGYAAALSYYYFLANIITFAQMFAIRQFVDEDKIHKKIQEQKKKPVKKSKFQKKMEDMAKQKGYNPQQRKK
ncbi:MAG: membrane protein insertase YidC [Bacteroidales bacterium]|nr:membrane protein insertase YidC [Bacteroidales bacterium]